jgi:hypothetical protein
MAVRMISADYPTISVTPVSEIHIHILAIVRGRRPSSGRGQPLLIALRSIIIEIIKQIHKKSVTFSTFAIAWRFRPKRCFGWLKADAGTLSGIFVKRASPDHLVALRIP